jgi:hypothetical protein
MSLSLYNIHVNGKVALFAIAVALMVVAFSGVVAAEVFLPKCIF